MGIRYSIDTDGILEQFGEFKQEVEDELNAQIKVLADQVHGFIVEKAQNELHTTRQTYLDNLSTFVEVSTGVFVCTLDEPALFIEDGLPQNFDMKPGLLKNAKGVTDKGVRYRVIAFDHNKPSESVVRQTDRNALRDALKPMNKAMQMEHGDRSLGALKPLKDASGNFISTKGPNGLKIHDNLQLGGRIPGRGNTPIFQNLNIYQKTSTSGKSAQMSALTFRTVTSAQTDKWIHPGLEAKKIFDAAYEKAIEIWDFTMKDEFVSRMQSKWKK